MKFIRDLIKNKNWSDDPEAGDFDADDLRRDFAEQGGYDSPLVDRHAQQAMDFDDDDDWSDAEFDMDAPQAAAAPTEQAPEATAPADERTPSELANRFMASLNNPANEAETPDEMPVMTSFDDDEFDQLEDPSDQQWNIGMSDEDDSSTAVDFQFEPTFEDEDEMEVFQDPIFQDEGSAREIEQAAMDAVREKDDLSEGEKEALVVEIRRAMDAVRHIRSDEEIGRQNAARDQLGRVNDAAKDNRILNETNDIMDEDANARRLQAIALMKAAASATKADPKLRNMASRDSALDSEEQTEYRQDLQNFEHPRLHTSRNRKPTDPSPMDAAMASIQERLARESVSDDANENVTPISRPTKKKEVGLNDLPILDRPAKVHSEILRHTSEKRTENPEEKVDTSALRAALQAARAPKTEIAPEPVREPSQPMQAAPAPAQAEGFAKNIWDIDGDADEPAAETPEAPVAEAPAEPAAPAAATPIIQVPQPTPGRAGRQAGRVKTRLLGFQHEDEPEDPFAKEAKPAEGASAGVFPVAWLVVTDGPGRGKAFALYNGVTQIGRGEGQSVRLDFGDLAISRENHAAIAFDDEKNEFYLGHGGKSNLVRLNSRPVLSTENLKTGDMIRIGETRLRFVALCGADFSWSAKDGVDETQRAFG